MLVFLLTSNRMFVCQPLPFVCVCVCTCLCVFVTLLFVINQAIQSDFSANNGISKQYIYTGSVVQHNFCNFRNAFGFVRNVRRWRSLSRLADDFRFFFCLFFTFSCLIIARVKLNPRYRRGKQVGFQREHCTRNIKFKKSILFLNRVVI